MTHEAGFLHAILESPDDDTPRLVFADWLEDHGQPQRAEFIRLQIELEPHRFDIDLPRVRELLAREEELLDLHEEEWLGPEVLAVRADLAASDPPATYGPFFRRGLPEVAAFHLDVLVEHGDDLLQAHPTIRELVVFDLQGRGSELARFDLPARILTLEVADWLEEEDAQDLLASPWFRGLSTVRLWHVEDLPWSLGPRKWPAGMRIEVVEFGGASTGEPGEINPELDRLAKRFAAAGRHLVPIRPALGRFPLLPDEGQNLHTGRLPDGRQLLFAHGRERSDPVVFAFFDDAGNLGEARQADDPGCCEFYEDYPVWLAKEFGFSPGLVWMREFRTLQGLGIQLLPGSPDDFIGPGDLWWWLYQGKYVINWCNAPWASRRTGGITDN